MYEALQKQHESFKNKVGEMLDLYDKYRKSNKRDFVSYNQAEALKKEIQGVIKPVVTQKQMQFLGQ